MNRPKRKKDPQADIAESDYSRFSNNSAEKGILSILFKHGEEYWPKADELNLSESHFYVSCHKALFRNLRRIYDMHGQLDLGSICALIPESELTSTGDISHLAEIYAYDSITSYWSHYTDQLIDTYRRRTTHDILMQSVASLKSGSIETGDIIRQLSDIEQTSDSQRPYIPMGRQGEAFVYYVPSRGEIVTLTKNDHRPQALLSLAPLSYWESRYGDLKVETAANECFAAQGNRLFSSNSARGLGTWKDEDAIIYNAGDKVISYTQDNPPAEISAIRGTTIYERKTPILHPSPTPLSDEESRYITTYFKALAWGEKESSILAPGWLAIAPLAGTLKFRPHMWINAPSGSGKSQLLDVIKHLLGTYALHIEGGTTEAGLRQTLLLDARCGIFDEAEANGESGAKAIERILSYLRSCSTNEGGAVLKGSTTGKALISAPRSMFLFASIGNQLERASDESRFATLSIRKIYDTEKLNAHLTKLSTLRPSLYLPNFPQRLLARILSNAPVTLQNIETIRTYLISKGEPGRRADLMSPLLAGYHSLLNSAPIAPIDLPALHCLIKSSHIAAIQDPDEQRCLNHILQYVTKEGFGVMELIESVWNNGNFEHCEHHLILKRHGLKIFKEEKMLAIADSHPKLSEAFERSDWVKGWGRILRNLQGARDRVSVRFSSSSHATKATKVPLPDMSEVRQLTSTW